MNGGRLHSINTLKYVLRSERGGHLTVFKTFPGPKSLKKEHIVPIIGFAKGFSVLLVL